MDQCAAVMMQCVQAMMGGAAFRPRVRDESPVRDLNIVKGLMRARHRHDDAIADDAPEDLKSSREGICDTPCGGKADPTAEGTHDFEATDAVKTLSDLRDENLAAVTASKKRPAAAIASGHIMKKPAMSSGAVVPPRIGYVQASRDAACELPAGWTIWRGPPRDDKYYCDLVTKRIFGSTVAVRKFLMSV